MSPAFHIAVGLDTGQSEGDPATFFGALAEALDGTVDILTIEDGFARPEGDGPDAVLLANWLGARTARIGLLPGAPLNVLEPFHVSTAIATLDYVTQGRAGLLVQPLRGDRIATARRAIGPLNGYPEPDPAALVHDTGEAIEVIRQLWDSWEDDAVIRDPVSQRFIDGDKLHYIRFQGARFSVLGPSITPRPPQGQPVVAITLEPGEDPAIAAGADLVFLAGTEQDLPAAIARLRAAGHPLVFADVALSFGGEVPAGRGLAWSGAPEGLAAQIEAWRSRLGVDGLRLLPRAPQHDIAPLAAILAGRGNAPGMLRARLGLAPAINRHVAAA